jgi:predicted secreted hydrolase
MRWLALLLLLVAGAGAADDVYDVLRRGGSGYAEVVPGKKLEFPADHLAHPAYRIEWWYLTANLTDERGQNWGLHWTLFRQALNADGKAEGWTSNQVWMAHAALTTPIGHRYEERFARGGIGQAGVAIEEGRFSAWLDDWQLRGDGAEILPGTLRFSVDNTTVYLDLDMQTPWVLQGDRGYSRKSAQGQASYYYSQPHIRVSGSIIKPSGEEVTVSGDGWLDREWSSQPLADNQPGWDWFSLHLQDGSALMVYRLRHEDRRDGGPPNEDKTNHWLSGTWITPGGQSRTLSANDIQLDALEFRRVERADDSPLQLPLRWSLALPAMGSEYRWTIEAMDPDHWLATAFPYWEGPVKAAGSNPGIGYLELTGYQ